MQAICKALFEHLEATSGEEVSYDDLISGHIGKGRTVLEIYIKKLNMAPLYFADDIKIDAADIVAHPTVEELLGTIFDTYKAGDWLVYYA